MLKRYFHCCALELEEGYIIERLRVLGRATERIMLRQFGTNTQRGAIFLGGLLLASVHRAPESDDVSLRASASTAAHELFDACLPTSTIGSSVRARYGVGGVIDEALTGLPSAFRVAVPALEHGTRIGMGYRESRLLAMSRLMQTVQDTTTLRRCGELGLRRLRGDGRCLEDLLLGGDDPDPFLLCVDER